MSMPTTEYFSFIDSLNKEKINHHIYILESNCLQLVRKCLREIYSIVVTSEDFESQEIANRLRLVLLRLQSSIARIPDGILEHCGMGSIDSINKKWGKGTANTATLLENLIIKFNETDSPLVTEIKSRIIAEIELYGIDSVKIWCHKKEISIYLDALHDIDLTEKNFISSASEYKQTNIFSTLLRIGPMRTHGWSAFPRSILSAPKFSNLLQFSWKGSVDDEQFICDPIFSEISYEYIFLQTLEEKAFNIDIEFIDSSLTNEEIDDLAFLSIHPIKVKQQSACVLLEFPTHRGILLSPGSTQIVFVKNEKGHSIIPKSATDILIGEIIIFHNAEADLGGGDIAVKAPLAAYWKKALREMYQSSYSLLIDRMKTSGIDLKSLDGAAKRWMRDPTECISAPETSAHFRKLIQDVLPPCLPKQGENRNDPSWKAAWNEIQKSRSDASQEGRIESVLINDQLIFELSEKLDFLDDHSQDGNYFSYNLDPNSGLTGTVHFYPVIGFSSDFKAPNELIGEIRKIDDLEIYRVFQE